MTMSIMLVTQNGSGVGFARPMAHVPMTGKGAVIKEVSSLALEYSQPDNCNGDEPLHGISGSHVY